MRNPKKRWLNILVCLLLVSGLMITGCSDAPSNSETISSANTQRTMNKSLFPD